MERCIYCRRRIPGDAVPVRSGGHAHVRCCNRHARMRRVQAPYVDVWRAVLLLLGWLILYSDYGLSIAYAVAVLFSALTIFYWQGIIWE